MRRAPVFACLAIALLAPAVARASPGNAAPPTCTGRDIFSEMKTSDPAGYAKIRAAADATPNTGALLWRIESKGGPASYLYGTIHTTDERVTTLSPKVTAAFNAATTVALEYVDETPEKSAAAMGGMLASKGFYPEGNGLKDVLTPAETSTLFKALADEGLPETASYRLRPWFAAFALALTVCEKQRVATGLLPLDSRLQRDAQAQGKRTVGLETLEFQIDTIAGLPENVQVSFLKATVGTIPLRDDALETMHASYLRRDLGTALPFTKYVVERAGYDGSVMDAFEREIGTKRNYGMRDAALPLLKDGGAFIAVGAMHLLGKEGLVELFRAKGYTVTAIE